MLHMPSEILLPLPFSLHGAIQNTDTHTWTHPTGWFHRNYNPTYDQSLREMHLMKLAGILKTVSTAESPSSSLLISKNAIIILAGLAKKDIVPWTIFICCQWNFMCFLNRNKCVKFSSLACSGLLLEEQRYLKQLIKKEKLNRKNLSNICLYVGYWVKMVRPLSALFLKDSKWDYYWKLPFLTPAFLGSHIK